MSHCRRLGPHDKDVVIFATREDHAVPSRIQLPAVEPQPGLILANGDINWNCPCLGGMATGPCGVQFRQAFSCFHYSEADPKGSDCFDKFKEMQTCMQRYPSLYNKDLAQNGDDDNALMTEALDASERETQQQKQKQEQHQVDEKKNSKSSSSSSSSSK